MTIETKPLGPSLRLRQGVGVVILHPHVRLVLAGLRKKPPPGTPPFWQMPQGGVDTGEPVLSAARREAHEETGIDPTTLHLHALLSEKTTYTLPAPAKKDGEVYDGQTHEWAVFTPESPDLPDLALAPDQEFSALAWIEPDRLVALTDDLRRGPYETVFGQMPWDAIYPPRVPYHPD